VTGKEFYKIKSEELKPGLKTFPQDFISLSTSKKINLPGSSLQLGKEFFGSIEITTSDGTPCYISDNPAEAKYIVYSRQNGTSEILIPEDEALVVSAVNAYEEYLDSLMKEISRDYLKLFPDNESSEAVSSVFRLLNLIRY